MSRRRGKSLEQLQGEVAQRRQALLLERAVLAGEVDERLARMAKIDRELQQSGRSVWKMIAERFGDGRPFHANDLRRLEKLPLAKLAPAPLSSALSRLCKDGKLERVGRGQYRVTPAQVDELDALLARLARTSAREAGIDVDLARRLSGQDLDE